MGFRFRFEMVLRQKQRAVDEVAGRHAQALRLVRQECESLAVLEDASASHEQRYAAVLAGGVLEAAGLQTTVRYAGFLTRAIAEQTNRIAEMRQRADQIHALLVKAQQDKEVFANLKARQRERYYQDLAARDRAFFDGIANTAFTAKHQAAGLIGSE